MHCKVSLSGEYLIPSISHCLRLTYQHSESASSTCTYCCFCSDMATTARRNLARAQRRGTGTQTSTCGKDKKTYPVSPWSLIKLHLFYWLVYSQENVLFFE